MTGDLAWAPPPPLQNRGRVGGEKLTNKTVDFNFVVYIIVQRGLSLCPNRFISELILYHQPET